MPSAMPRNIENEPSVTISGGMLQPRDQQRIQRAARAARAASAISAAAAMGSRQSRHAAPNTTAASPIIEPTERSMPPVIMIGVSASASSPSSTLSRTTSKKLPTREKVLGAIAAKIGDLERQREQQHPLAVREAALPPGPTLAERQALPAYLPERPRTASMATAARMIAPWIARSQYALMPRNVSAGPIIAQQDARPAACRRWCRVRP